MRTFAHFVAIDWSGAIGERQRGIAVAVCDAGGGSPQLVERSGGWSRFEALSYLRNLPDNTLVGLDLGMSLPFLDCGAYFPGLPYAPQGARELWALVDDICCNDAHLAANSFVDHPYFSPYFRRPGGREGARFKCDEATHGRGRFRVTERAQAATGCRPYSNFNLVGAAQVGKSSLTGMRVLNRLTGHLPVWPFDPLPDRGSVVVEIYTTIAAMASGRGPGRAKMRSFEELNPSLAALKSPPVPGDGAIDDHRADALLSAAWLRMVAGFERYWQPRGLTEPIARTEGWTFGAF